VAKGAILLLYFDVCYAGSRSQAVSKPVCHIPLVCAQWKTPDNGQRNCPKHIEFYSKNKFEKLVHLVGFIIRICHDARSPERQKLIIPFQGLSTAWMWNCCFFFQGGWWECWRGWGSIFCHEMSCSQTHQASGRMKNNFLLFVSVSINLHDWISISAFAKLRKSLLASLCVCLPVGLSTCLFVRTEELGFH